VRQRRGGGYFVLIGKDAGGLFAYGEHAPGLAPDGGLGLELGRIDFSGTAKDFKAEYFNGPRTKWYVSLGGDWSIGGAYAWSFAGENNKYKLTASSATISYGMSMFGFFSIGGNKGNIVKPWWR
jgi:hypothetical protein